MLPPNHVAPFQLREVKTGKEIMDGEHYIPLYFEDGTERGYVAVFLYDPIGVCHQLMDLGYRAGEPLRARRGV